MYCTMENGYWYDDDDVAPGSAQSWNRITTLTKRFTQRKGYTRLPSRSRRMRMAKLGRRQSKGASLVWRLRAVPRLRFRVIESAARSWMSRIRDTYVDMMTGLGRSLTMNSRPHPKKKAVEEFNTKVVIEIYKSLGIQVCPESQLRLSSIG